MLPLGSLDPNEINWRDPALKTAARGGLFFRDAAASTVRAYGGNLCYLSTPVRGFLTDDDGIYLQRKGLDYLHSISAYERALAAQGVTAISPVLHSTLMMHVDFDNYLDPLDRMVWLKWCAPLLERSDAIVIPRIQGWDESLGVWREAVHALKSNRKVLVLCATDFPFVEAWPNA